MYVRRYYGVGAPEGVWSALKGRYSAKSGVALHVVLTAELRIDRTVTLRCGP